MSEFDGTEFKSVVTSSRGLMCRKPVVITHNKGKNKEEQTYKISSEAMNKCGFNYKDKVDIQFSPDFKVCRIIKRDRGLTLSKQTFSNPESSAVMRMLFKPDIHPNFIEITSKKDVVKIGKVVFESDKEQYEDGVLTFKLKQRSK